MPDPVGGIVVDVGIEAFKHLLPSGIEYVRTAVFGKRITVVGPSEVGKTSFVEYCQFGTLPEVGEPIRTDDIPPGAKFVVKGTADARLELRVKRAIDLPGQYVPENQAALLARQRPHLVVAISDVTKPDHVEWVGKLLAEYRSKLLTNEAARRRVRAVVFVMSKVDLLPAAEEAARVAARRAELQGLSRQHLADVFGSRAANFLALPAVLANTARGTAPVRKVIQVAARALARTRK